MDCRRAVSERRPAAAAPDGGAAEAGGQAAPGEPVRIDKWLWAARVFRTRALATRACAAGHVTVDGRPAKPAREVRPGEVVVAWNGVLRRTLRVLVATDRRVGAKLVAGLCADETPEEERARATLSAAQRILERPPGLGRPTKRDRRKIGEAWGEA